MNDLIDRANIQAQRNLDAALEVARLKSQAAIANDVVDCIDCDKPIGAKRKQFMPSATRCIACQGVSEAKERRR